MSYYVNLFHGRNTPDEEMNDWGFEGPVIGPIDYISWTYGLIKLHDTDGDPHHIKVVQGLVVYDGKYYGDFGIISEEEKATLSGRTLITLEQFIPLN